MHCTPVLASSLVVLFVSSVALVAMANAATTAAADDNAETGDGASCPCGSRRDLLLEFLQAVGGNPITLQWNATSTVCDWPGLECGSEDVVGIDLHFKGLSGTIPEVIAQLAALSTLDLSNNSLHGTLPASLASLSALRVFNVSHNDLTGTLPSTFSSWTATRMFLVHRNQLTGTLPAAYSSWGTSVRVARVDNNQMHGTLPAVYGTNWLSLRHLDVSSNSFGGTVPSSFSNWKEIDTFSCTDNNLTGPLHDLAHEWPKLTKFEARRNAFSGPLPVLGNHTALENLYLNKNYFTGTLPPEWTNFGSSIERIDVSDNRLTGTLPPPYAAFDRLKEFYVHGNALEGTLPSAYAQWARIKRIDVSNNKLSGTLPPEWGDGWGDSIQRVTLSNNTGISGTLPVAWRQWTSLLVFAATHINLSGTLPPQYGAWTRVDNFRITDTLLSGTLSPLFSEWHNMEALRLGSNRLTGTLPPEYGRAWQLIDTLRLENNQLSGTLPSSWVEMGRLRSLSLFANRFEGTLPPEYAQMPNLVALGLAMNRFSGTLPASWGTGKMRLGLLALQDNEGLVGTFPPSWGTLFMAPLALLSICNSSLCGAASDIGLLQLVCLPEYAMFLDDTEEMLTAAVRSLSVPCGDPQRRDATHTRTLPPEGDNNDDDGTALSASLLADVKASSAVAGVSSSVAAALVGADPGDLQMLSSVLGASCMCGSVAGATSSMSYARSPFVAWGILGVVVGNAALAVGLFVLHWAAVKVLPWCRRQWAESLAVLQPSSPNVSTAHGSNGDRGRQRPGRQPPRGEAGSSDTATRRKERSATETARLQRQQPAAGVEEAVERLAPDAALRFPNLSVRCVTFLLSGVVGNVASLLFTQHSADRVAVGVTATIGIACVCWALESRIYQGRIVSNHKFRYHSYKPGTFDPVPHSVASKLLPRGCWKPMVDRKAYGSLVSAFTHRARRAWIAMPLINAAVQILASVPLASSAGCDALQSVMALVAVAGSALFLVFRPHRVIVASWIAAASLWVVAVAALLGMLCRHGVVSSSTVASLAVSGSFFLIASKLVVLAIPLVEQRLLLLLQHKHASIGRSSGGRDENITAPEGGDSETQRFLDAKRSRVLHTLASLLAVPPGRGGKSNHVVSAAANPSACRSEPIPSLFLTTHSTDAVQDEHHAEVRHGSVAGLPGAGAVSRHHALKQLIDLVCDKAKNEERQGYCWESSTCV